MVVLRLGRGVQSSRRAKEAYAHSRDSACFVERRRGRVFARNVERVQCDRVYTIIHDTHK